MERARNHRLRTVLGVLPALLLTLLAVRAVALPEARFRALVEGFPSPPAASKAVFLGLREPASGFTHSLLAPRELRLSVLETELRSELALTYDVAPAGQLDNFLAPLVAKLSDFGSKSALDAQATADLNLSFESDYLFVASLARDDGDQCGYGDHYRVELRRFAGQSPREVRILANTSCVVADGALDLSWNVGALVLWAGLLSLAVVGVGWQRSRRSAAPAPRRREPDRPRAAPAPPVETEPSPQPLPSDSMTQDLSASPRRAPEAISLHDDEEAAALEFEQEGEFVRAAQLWEQVGDLGHAAPAWEQAGERTKALVCYLKLDDLEKIITLSDELGRWFEAGRAAYEHGQKERAAHYLLQVEETDHRHPEACAMLGTFYFEQGEASQAVEQIDHVLRASRLELLTEPVLGKYAAYLEAGDRVQDALVVYGVLRANTLDPDGVATRIEVLQDKQRRISEASAAKTQGGAPGAPAPSGDAETSKESRYEIIEELGRGAMGVVYKARDTYLGRTVALKHLIDSLREHPKAVKFFEREARSAAALNHPNIVTVYDAGQENGTYFISMEFLEGTPFDHIVRNRGPLDPAIVCGLGVQVAKGLAYAHKNRIIHRDIKTANLFLTSDKVVKVMDFGLAKMVEEVRRSATVIGGTPYYMPPEQTLGQAVDHRADLYAFGVTLFQLLTASYPFSQGDVAYHHCHTPPPDPREFIATVPPALSDLIMQLMAKKVEDRVQDAEEVEARLQAVIDDLRNGSSAAS